MYEPSPTTYSATPDETLIAEAIEGLPSTGDRHHTVVHLEHQTVCLSVARAPAQDDCWVWFSAAAAERAELTSDRLLPLVSAGNFDGWFYVAHDIGTAVPLSEYRRISELSTARSLALLLGIAHALDDAVSQGKPPCEVTPDSVFLDPRFGAMVGDLGVAREALGNPAASDDAHAAWVAPEVLRGEDAHPRSAVYSFGAIAYTLLTGGPPHTGSPQQIVNAAPPRLSDVRPDLPATLDTIFAVAMAADPRKRYATAAEARHLLNLVIYGAPSMPALETSPRFRRGSAAPKGTPARHAPRLQPAVEEHPHRGRVVAGLLVGGALLAGGLAGIVAAGGDNPPAPHPRVTAAGMSVELPDGWKQRPAEAGRLEAYPVARAGFRTGGGHHQHAPAALGSGHADAARQVRVLEARGGADEGRRPRRQVRHSHSDRQGVGHLYRRGRRGVEHARPLRAHGLDPKAGPAEDDDARGRDQDPGALAAGRQPAAYRSGGWSSRTGPRQPSGRPDPGGPGARRHLRARRPSLRGHLERPAGREGGPRDRRHVPHARGGRSGQHHQQLGRRGRRRARAQRRASPAP